MTKWAPERKDTIAALADEILHNYGRGRVVVAVDGPDGAGTADFADDVATALRSAGHAAFRASTIDFQRPRAEREARGASSGEGYYRDSFDYSVLRRVLVEPFRLGGSAAFVTAAFDPTRDAQVEPKWLTGPDDAILLIDGVFLLRPELAGLWNYSVWVDVTHEHGAGQGSSEAEVTRQNEAQAIYRKEVGPRTKATAIVDNTDINHPRRSFADSC
jgi:uridine kinase